MAKLIYVTPTSLDGYLADGGNLDWSPPDDAALAFISDVLRPMGTYLYGRKIYRTMAVWQTPELIPGPSEANLDFARIWQAADKIVYSKTLTSVSTPKTRLEREFDTGAVRNLKTRVARDMCIGGATLASEAIVAGLVDEYHFFVVPMMIGGGLRVLPPDVTVKLELLDERRFSGGWVYLRYGVRRSER